MSNAEREHINLTGYNVTGYWDSEGCFNISIYKDTKKKCGFSVTLSVEFKQHAKSFNLVYALKEYFKDKGSINFSNKDKTVLRYKISSIKDIIHLVLPHFDKYPLLSSKQLNYIDFKKAALFINSGKHLTVEGIKDLKSIIKSMNTNRSFLDKWEFCNKNYNNTEFKIPADWIQSFFDGEGSFSFLLRNNSASTRFTLSQNIHDYYLMKLVLEFFGKGKLYPLSINGTLENALNYLRDRKLLSLNSVINYGILSRKDIKSTIIPFFKKYPLYSIKNIDFKDWELLIEMSENKAYLNIENKKKWWIL